MTKNYTLIALTFEYTRSSLRTGSKVENQIFLKTRNRQTWFHKRANLPITNEIPPAAIKSTQVKIKICSLSCICKSPGTYEQSATILRSLLKYSCTLDWSSASRLLRKCLMLEKGWLLENNKPKQRRGFFLPRELKCDCKIGQSGTIK